MKKILMAIPYFLLWILYFILTIEKRNEYMMSEQKGYRCTGSVDSSTFIPGSARTYYFDRTKKPVREYATWREFWRNRGYYKKAS